MFKNSVHKDYSLIAIGNRRWAWLETPLLTALVLGLYVAGLSCLAKVESQPGPVRYWPCLLMATPIVLAWFVNNPDAFRQNALLASAILGLWVLFPFGK